MTKVKDTIDVCGVLVHAVKGQEKNVENALNIIGGVEVHHITDNSRLVVTIEKDSQKKIADTMDGFNDIDGVVSTILTYQHSESA